MNKSGGYAIFRGYKKRPAVIRDRFRGALSGLRQFLVI